METLILLVMMFAMPAAGLFLVFLLLRRCLSFLEIKFSDSVLQCFQLVCRWFGVAAARRK